jgi:hypothetical protein
VTNLADAGPGSLRQAIIDTPIAGTVDFADGLSGTIPLTSAPLTINKILTIAGPGADVIRVSGNNARQVLVIPAPFTVAIWGLAIANGNTGAGLGSGAGISNAGALTVTGCTLSGNHADTGGGISNSGNLTVTGCTLSGNSASTAFNAAGGGIYNTGNLTVTNSTLSGNQAGAGGGILNSGNLTVTSSTLSGNSAGTQSGGGGILSTGGTVTVNSSTLSGNSTSGSGGGIRVGSGNVIIDNSTFSLNTAVTGAGISHTGTGTVTLTSSTLSQNFASNQGGGIFHTGTGTVVLRDTIVARNSAPMSSVDVMGALNSQGHNLIGNGAGGSGYGATDLVGTAPNPIDPLLGPLEDNGGPTKTMALLAGSPAIDAGDNTGAPDWDQRGPGYPRIVNGIIDIGAFEVQSSAVVAAFRVDVPATATAGTPFGVTVTAVDAQGHVVPGYTGTVTFSSADPYGATLPAAYTFTTADAGRHTFPAGATLYTAGTWDITAADASGGITGSANVTVTPAAADHLVFLQQPSDTTAGQTISPAVAVEVVDAFGNVETGDNSDTVALALGSNPGGDTLGGTLTQTVVNGVATFSDLSLTKAASGYTLVATSGGLAALASNGFAITPAAADHLVFLQQPSDTAAGQTISPAVMVAVVDAFGNIETGDSNDTVTLSIGVDPSGGTSTLGGTLTVTVVNGVATFSDLSIDQPGMGYTLHATIGGSLPDIDSAAFSITP